MVFGYCARILLAIGRAASLIDRFFRNSLPLNDFRAHRAEVFECMQVCTAELPTKIQHADQDEMQSAHWFKIRHKNACIDVAFAHILAAQVFLMRAYGSQGKDLAAYNVASIVLRLEAGLLRVPINSSSAAMMLWPIFVLGCESSCGSSMRSSASFILDNVCRKHNFSNIPKVRETLHNRMWANEELWRDKVDGQITTEPAGGWVRYCWHEHIDLCLA